MAPEIAAFLASLEKTQYHSPEKMRAYQRGLLDRLLRHARTETDFYPDRLAPVFRPDDTIDWDRWDEIPILTRVEAQANTGALKARNMSPAAGRAIESHTSGSTGRAFQHFASLIQNVASSCANERFFQWHNLDPLKLSAVIRAPKGPTAALYPDGDRMTGWRMTSEQSVSIALSVRTPIDKQVEWLRRVSPAYLTTYPANLREIGRLAHAEGRPLALQAVLTIGEMIPNETREDIRSLFGTEPLDRYGSTEIGLVSATCPHSGKHHVESELVLVEVVDEADRPAPPGTVGRIIATSFYNHAMPLIRYDMGDYGVLSPEPCGCGRTLPVLDRIVGRARNIFRFADGTRVWPDTRSREIQPFVPHRQYQIAQVALDRVELRYVPMSPWQSNDLPGLTAYVRGRLHPSLIVDTVAVDEIARSPSGKFEDYVSLIA